MDDFERGKQLALLFNKYKFALYPKVGYLILFLFLIPVFLFFIIEPSLIILLYLELLLVVLIVPISLILTLLNKKMIEEKEGKTIEFIYGNKNIPFFDFYQPFLSLIRYSNSFQKGFNQHYWAEKVNKIVILILLVIVLSYFLFTR